MDVTSINLEETRKALVESIQNHKDEIRNLREELKVIEKMTSIILKRQPVAPVEVKVTENKPTVKVQSKAVVSKPTKVRRARRKAKATSYADKYDNIGTLIKDILEVENITAKSLAESLGVSSVSISHWKLGRTSPSKEKFNKLSDAIVDVCKHRVTKAQVLSALQHGDSSYVDPSKLFADAPEAEF